MHMLVGRFVPCDQRKWKKRKVNGRKLKLCHTHTQSCSRRAWRIWSRNTIGRIMGQTMTSSTATVYRINNFTVHTVYPHTHTDSRHMVFAVRICCFRRACTYIYNREWLRWWRWCTLARYTLGVWAATPHKTQSNRNHMMSKNRRKHP